MTAHRFRVLIIFVSMVMGLGIAAIVGLKLFVQFKSASVVIEIMAPAESAVVEQARKAGIQGQIRQSSFISYEDVSQKPVNLADLRRIRMQAAWKSFNLWAVDRLVIYDANTVFLYGFDSLRKPVVLHFRKSSLDEWSFSESNYN